MARILIVLVILVGGLIFGFAFFNSYWARKQLESNRKVKAKFAKWLKRPEPGPVTEKQVTHLLVLWWAVLAGIVGAFSAGLVVRGIQPFRILIIAVVCAAFGGWVTHHMRAGWVEKKGHKKNH
jgi:hypothetical protein